MEKKLAGITCDTYKVEKFKKELTNGGFTDFEVAPYKNSLTLIKVTCLESEIDKIGEICEGVEAHFAAIKN